MGRYDPPMVRHSAAGRRFGVVVGRYNAEVGSRLLEGCLAVLAEMGAATEDIEVVWVPGAFEIPLVARRLARGRADAVVCLGAVIRGETPHFDFVAEATARGIAEAGWETDKPVVFGVLTTDTREQAMRRAGGEVGHKGREAAATAVEMVGLLAGRRG
ncbi:MAG: 6,7-dimethyl-8-ribityllumazine synthase [Actinomycetota bacterium]